MAEAEERRITLGKKIRTERERRGLSKAELARLVGVSPPYIPRVENDEIMPTLDIAKRFAKVLEFSLEEVGEEVLTSAELDEKLKQQFAEMEMEPDTQALQCDYTAKRALLRILSELNQRQFVGRSR